MNWIEWRSWYKELGWSMKWFVLLVLIRPILESLFFLKEISPVLSPLYLIGVLTPIAILASFLDPSFPSKKNTRIIKFLMGTWSVLALFNVILILAVDFDFTAVGNSIKYSAPVFLFFYLIRFVRSERDLVGLLMTFLLSTIYPGLMIIYEYVFEPINVAQLSIGRGGGTRIQGSYADVMNYAIYLTGASLCSMYFFLRKIKQGKLMGIDYVKLAIPVGLSVLGLFSIKQSSTWGVFMAILVLFIVASANKLRGSLLIIVMLPMLYLFGGRIYKSQIEPLVNKEYKVIEGDAKIERSFNGRMSRWKKYYEYWEEFPIQSKLFGVGTSGDEKAGIMISGGMHSDYIRVMFLSGIIGLVFYLAVLIYIGINALRFNGPNRFLILATLAAVILHSVTTVPLIYTGYLSIVFAIFAFSATPQIQEKNEV